MSKRTEAEIQIIFGKWMASIDAERRDVESNVAVETAAKATLLCEEEIVNSICPSNLTVQMKLTVALHYVRLNTPHGEDRDWDMVESALRDLGGPMQVALVPHDNIIQLRDRPALRIAEPAVT